MKNNHVINLLNKHFNKNIELGLLYTKYYTEISKTSLTNFAKYIKDLAEDKLGIHKDKILEYLCEINQPLNIKTNFESSTITIEKIVNSLIENEKQVIDDINEIAKTALEENDFQTFEFIQWFVKDGLKDYNEVLFIANLFETSKDYLLIDHKIKELVE